MSNAEFTSAFEAFLAAVGKYNSAQRATLLNGFKADCQEAISAIGQPQPEPAAAAAPAAAAPAQAATPTGAAAAGQASAKNSEQQGSSVTGAKPSSRVLQGPGGNSSFSLSGGDDRPATHSGRKQYAGTNSTNNSSIQFGASDGDAKTSVKVHAAPGGKSSIQFGDDSAPGAQAKPQQRVDRLDDSTQHPKKPHGGRKLIHAAGGETHDVFNQKPDTANAGVHTSVKTNAAPGGNSQISFGGDAKAAAAPAEAAPAAEAGASSAAGGDVNAQLLKAIIDAVYRKGKVKDTFTKFTGNKGKVLTAAELKDGVISIGINGFTDAQAESLISRFAADKKSMSYPEFMKMMAAN